MSSRSENTYPGTTGREIKIAFSGEDEKESDVETDNRRKKGGEGSLVFLQRKNLKYPHENSPRIQPEHQAYSFFLAGNATIMRVNA